MKSFKLFVLFSLLALSQLGHAQDEDEAIVAIVGAEPSVEINLGAMMLGMLSSATEDEEQGIAEILSSLESIKVKVYEINQPNRAIRLKTIKDIKQKLTELSKQQLTNGYEMLAKIKEDDSLVYVLAKMDKKYFKSLNILALDDDQELVIINIEGKLLMSQLGKLMEHFDVDLDINGLKIKKQAEKDK